MQNNSPPVLQDNPADFSFFFDTSRRRTCYIAPERFIQELAFSSPGEVAALQSKARPITSSMDIFSLGYASSWAFPTH